MFLAISALAFSGLLSIAVVFLRLPFFSSSLSFAQHIFDNALVVHVNLSILVWMCSFISLLLIANSSQARNWFNFSWFLSILSVLLIFISAFIPSSEIIKSNYIPILQNKLFLFGLGLFFISMLVTIIVRLILIDSLTLEQISIAIIFLCSVLCLVLAYYNMPARLYQTDKALFYEYLFWGVGHLLQFTFVQGMFLVYLIILNKLTAEGRIPLIINTILVVFTPLIYLFYSVDSTELIQFFTWHMRIAGAFLPCALTILVCRNIKTLLHNNLLHSFILFIYGGILGVLTIEGNVIIPAHYHGSVVGVTIAFMSFIYYLFSQTSNYKSSLIKIQINAYSIGHFLHITGLVWLGGYGALRKVADLPSISSNLARACFILGGAISIIGGMLFIIISFLCLLKKR